MEFLATNPSILEDFARQLMGSMALGLPAVARAGRAGGDDRGHGLAAPGLQVGASGDPAPGQRVGASRAGGPKRTGTPGAYSTLTGSPAGGVSPAAATAEASQPSRAHRRNVHAGWVLGR